MSHTIMQTDDGLESKIEIYGKLNDQEVSEIAKSKNTIEALKEWYGEYKNSGKLNRQVIRGYTQGYDFKDPKVYASSTETRNAVAWTTHFYNKGVKENILGANTYIEDAIGEIQNDHPLLNYEQIKEYVLAHEINHMIRHNHIIPKSQNDHYKIEMDNELDLYSYFKELSTNANPEESTHYSELAGVAATRYIAQKASYAKENGLEFNLEEEARQAGIDPEDIKLENMVKESNGETENSNNKEAEKSNYESQSEQKESTETTESS